MPRSLDDRAEQLLREVAPQVLGAVIRRFRDFASSEDAVQEALLAASTQWPRDGVPDNPRGWLIQVASRRMTDQVRSELARRRRETITAQESSFDLTSTLEAIDLASTLGAANSADLADQTTHSSSCSCAAIPALTLVVGHRAHAARRGGLTTAEIANAFLVPEATMAQRISRAKQTIKTSGVPFGLPTPEERAQRLVAVLHVLYLIFNEGYTSSAGPNLHRTELSGEAIRLTRLVHRLLPDDGEVGGLLALMLLTDARRAARTGPDGELIPLTKQDRSSWDRRAIEGRRLDTATLSEVGRPYQLHRPRAVLTKRAVEDRLAEDLAYTAC